MRITKNSTINQKIKSEKILKRDINHIFKKAKDNNILHRSIINQLQIKVYNNQMYLTLPNYIMANINGYIDANFYNMKYFIQWGHFYDDVFVGEKLPYGKNFDQAKVKSYFFYKGTENIYS